MLGCFSFSFSSNICLKNNLKQCIFSDRLMTMKQKSKPVCESKMVLHVKSEVKLAIPNVVSTISGF